MKITAALLLVATYLSAVEAPAPGEAATASAARSVALILVKDALGSASGSGFVIHRQGAVALIATNAHVVGARVVEGRRIEVVLNSGQGDQRVVPGTVVGVDAEEDLAFISIAPETCPAPLPVRAEAVQETARVRAFGFPLGEMLATGGRHPSITITTGSVTGVRRDDRGCTNVIQLDADVNPGNSGGALLDEQGRVTGVVNAKLFGTGVSFAIPVVRVTEDLAGRPLGHECVADRKGPARCDVEATAALIDPLHKIAVVEILWAVGNAAEPDIVPPPSGAWGQAVANMTSVRAAIRGEICTARIQVPSAAWIETQVRCVRSDGSVIFGRPTVTALPPAPVISTPGDDWVGDAPKRAPTKPASTGRDLDKP